MFKKILQIAAALAIVGYLAFCTAVYVCPQWFFYHPSAERSDVAAAVAAGFPADEVHYRSADGTELYGWFVKPSAGRKIVVYFHGNAYNIEAFYHKLIPFVKAGYGAFIGEYRGFSGIPGELRQVNLEADALAAVDYLHTQGYRNSDMIIYGMSLGSHMAVDTVFRRGQDDAFAALILEVPFDSVFNVVKQRFWPVFPFDLLVKDKYENASWLARIKIPVLVMAAAEDKVVPPARAEALFSAANGPKNMIIYPGAGHSDLYKHQNYRDILQWLQNNEETE